MVIANDVVPTILMWFPSADATGSLLELVFEVHWSPPTDNVHAAI
jgi:hypothetical protein